MVMAIAFIYIKMKIGIYSLDDTMIVQNTGTLWSKYEENCIWVGDCEGGFTIMNNVMIHHGGSDVDHNHPDIIQMYNIGSTNDLTMTFANNLLIMDNDINNRDGQGIYASNVGISKFLIYNNIIVMKAVNNIPIRLDGVDVSHEFSVEILNNTIYQVSHPSVSKGTAIRITLADSVTAKNNIIAMDSTTNVFYAFGLTSINEIKYKDIDYNIYSDINGSPISFCSPLNGARTYWSDWQALGYDNHSNTDKIQFSNNGGNKIENYRPIIGSRSIDSGFPIRLFNIDIIGATRPQGKGWDMGAFEQ